MQQRFGEQNIAFHSKQYPMKRMHNEVTWNESTVLEVNRIILITQVKKLLHWTLKGM